MMNAAAMRICIWRRMSRGVVLTGLLIPSVAHAAIRYVASYGGNMAPYTNEAMAATSIQPAINASVSGDFVRVAAGTYVLTNTITVPAGIAVQGVDADTTIVDGNNAVRCFALSGNASLTDLTITRGNAEWGVNGAGVYGGIVSNCMLIDNHAAGGHGSRVGGGAYASTLYNCTLADNTASGQQTSIAGGGAYDCTLYNCTLSGNTASIIYTYYAGGGAASGTLYNCILYPDTSVAALHNCFTNDPRFVGGGDYSLQPDSPCINAANPLTATAQDSTGLRRDRLPDLGAYEYFAGEDHDMVMLGYPPDNEFDVEIQSVTPRIRSNLIDIEYVYSNGLPHEAEIRGAAYMADEHIGNLTYASDMYPMSTLAEGTATNYGVGILPSVDPRQLTWDAGVDIGSSLSNIKVVLWACETSALPLSQHFVTLPAVGTNSALTISRYAGDVDAYALNRALLFASWRGWATNSGSILYAAGGAYDGQVIFDTPTTPTEVGKLWMCEKLGNGIRLATAAEIQRAQEATTPGTVAQRTSFRWPGMKVNEFGIETGLSNSWYFVKE